MMTIEALFWLIALESYKAKLLACVEVHPVTGCWEWRRSGDGRYGHFWMLGARFKAHVASALLWCGLRLRKRVLRHTCDNAACCNPGHLIPGTQKQNRADASDRGRRAGGGLTTNQVKRIRNLSTRGHSDAVVAARCGCEPSTVWRLKTGRMR